MAKEPEKKGKNKRPTALKRDIQNEKKRAINKTFKSAMRTAIRRFNESLAEGDKEKIQANLSEAYSYLDKAVKRGLIKRNNASRHKSRLTAKAAAKA